MVNARTIAGGRSHVGFFQERAGFMLGAVVFTYGMLMSFVLSGASRNAKESRPNPPMLQYVGYVLLGTTAAVSVILLGYAAYGFATDAVL